MSSAISLRKFSYAIAKSPKDRHQAIKRAIAKHGADAVLARLEALVEFYPEVMKIDIEFVRNSMAPIVQPPAMPAIDAKAILEQPAVVAVAKVKSDMKTMIGDALRIVHQKMIPAIAANDTDALALLVTSMQILVSMM